MSVLIPSIYFDIAAPIDNLYFRVRAKFAIWCPITDKAVLPQQRTIGSEQEAVKMGGCYCPLPIFPIVEVSI